MALISVQDVVLGFGEPHLFDGISFQIEPGDRICLLGRNGVGKSTLLKLLAGEIHPDSGEITRQKMLTIASLEQEVPRGMGGSVFDVVAKGLGNIGMLLSEYLGLEQSGNVSGNYKRRDELQDILDREDGWRLTPQIENVLSQTQLDPFTHFSDLSAGMKRRVLFARALVTQPDILLLDEPTNHLDIKSITFLESFIHRFVKTLLFVSHDRSFVKNIAKKIFELDRGKLTAYGCDYETFMNRRLADFEVEEKQNHNFDKKLKAEEKWIRQGIKARRTRNEGRVRALEKLRNEYSARRKKVGSASFNIQDTLKSGKLVIEAKNIACEMDGKRIIQPFSTTIMRGDRVGVIGPNGSGKTTLLKLLLEERSLKEGSVRHGTHFQLAYFDQLRDALDEQKTVSENIDGGNDFIVFNGEKRHVVSYLKDFLFTPERSRTPVHVLSGGEKNRLMLAKLFTCPFNVLVLDEPTNDLDVETLELLEEILFEFKGTLLLVSHDRAFLNHVVTTIISIEAKGRVVQYAGGYDDFLHQQSKSVKKIPDTHKKESKKVKIKAPPAKKKKLGYMEKRELEALPQKIESLESEQEALFTTLSDPDLYKKDKTEITSLKARLEAVDSELKTTYQRWEELEAIGA